MIIYNTKNTILGTLEIKKANHQLLEHPRTARVRKLAAADIPAMAKLSECIYHNLREGQECFIHKKDAAYFDQSINQAENTYIGVFLGSKLIAMSYMKMVGNNTGLWEEFPYAGLDFFSESRQQRLNTSNIEVACLGADSVHPDYRGNNLNSAMVRFRMCYAQKNDATDCVSIIDRKNVWNMTPYFNNDFAMLASTIDPLDNGKIALLHRPLKEDLAVNNHYFSEVNYQDYEEIDRQFSKGKIGVGINRKNGNVKMVKTDYYRQFNQSPTIANDVSKAYWLEQKSAGC